MAWLPILMITGSTDSAAIDAATGSTPLLGKPFDLAEIGAAVAEALKGTAPSRSRAQTLA